MQLYIVELELVRQVVWHKKHSFIGLVSLYVLEGHYERQEN
jgi:hypothetical protein